MNQRGFTLVELSIVLVILGLLVGGVLTGQSLIRAAEMRSVTTQEQRYVTATQTFRDKYFALPGDMTNAQSYWGVATNCPGTSAQPSTTAATCNGDGDGKISYTGANSDESFRFWQHLANAGLIEGNYSGVTAGGNSYTATSANSPAGRISSSLWWDNNWGTVSSDGYKFDGQYDNIFIVGSVQANSYPYLPIFKPDEAYNIDTKIDDGKPATGRVVTHNNTSTWTAQTCTDATAGNVLTANYLLTSTALSCALIFRQAF